LTPTEQERIKVDSAAIRSDARFTRGGVHVTPTGQNARDVSGAELRAELEARWSRGGPGFASAYSDAMSDAAANELVAEFVRSKIREVVRDPATAELLSPRDHPIGSKRLVMDIDYYETFNRPNVQLVDVRNHPILEVRPTGIVTGGGAYPLDTLVLATGFDAITGALSRIDIRGVAGQLLKDKWAEGPVTYLGLATAGFPNLFFMTGPGSPAVLSNMMVSIEQHVDWISAHLVFLRDAGLASTEATAEAEAAWTAHVQEVAAGTLFHQASSWYRGSNTPGKPQVFTPYVGGVDTYRRRCDEVADGGYTGFTLRSVRATEGLAVGPEH